MAPTVYPNARSLPISAGLSCDNPRAAKNCGSLGFFLFLAFDAEPILVCVQK
jgi:hypothetical protein